MAKRYFTPHSEGKPGEISENLRLALGMPKDGLPIWIHRMRILGYPPGWLKKADMSNTTIKLFDGTEQPECNEELSQTQYNPDSFIMYPGFNVALPPNIKDKYQQLGMPPMMDFQQLNYAKMKIKAIKPVPYKRLRLADDRHDSPCLSNSSESSANSSQNANSEEKGSKKKKNRAKKKAKKALENQMNELQKEEDDQQSNNYNKASPEVVTLDDEDEESIQNSTSYSTKEAENSEQAIADQSDAEQNKDEIKESPESPEHQEDPQNSFISVTVQSDDSKFEDASLLNDSVLNSSKDITQNELDFSNSSKLTLISMGAPVPQTLNGQKPPLENFSVGMGELIYFENLPTSTGVFEKMRKVIKKIRKTIG